MEEDKKVKLMFGTSKEPKFETNEGFKHRLNLYPIYCEAIEGERKQRHLILERNIVVFDSKDEAIKFIKTIPFRNIPQEVILNKRHNKWVVHYLTLEEE